MDSASNLRPILMECDTSMEMENDLIEMDHEQTTDHKRKRTETIVQSLFKTPQSSSNEPSTIRRKLSQSVDDDPPSRNGGIFQNTLFPEGGLPPEVEEIILSSFDFPSLAQSSLVSKTWHNRIKNAKPTLIPALIKEIARTNIRAISDSLVVRADLTNTDGSYAFSFTLEKATGKFHDSKEDSVLDQFKLTKTYMIHFFYQNAWQANIHREAYNFQREAYNFQRERRRADFFTVNQVTCPADCIANEMLLMLNKTAEFALQRFIGLFGCKKEYPRFTLMRMCEDDTTNYFWNGWMTEEHILESGNMSDEEYASLIAKRKAIKFH